jgi:protease I
VEADVARDRTLTSHLPCTDLRNAGATVVDQQVCINGNLITIRLPKDLPALCQAIIERFANTPAHT